LIFAGAQLSSDLRPPAVRRPAPFRLARLGM